MAARSNNKRGAHAAHAAPAAPTPKKRSTGKTAVVAVIVVVVISVIGVGIFLGPRVPGMLSSLISQPGNLNASSGNQNRVLGVNERALSDEEALKMQLKTPQIASYEGIVIRSAIAPADLTAILFHQASTPWALEVETDLPQANTALATENHSTRINNKQTDVSGWLDAEVLRLWRTGATMNIDTAIDIGGDIGTPVYAPMTGTVVLISEYLLEDRIPDIEIHIQPDGRPDLDCVVIHTTDPVVKAGDHVEAGVTQISSVRDLSSNLSGIQLAEYTPEGDGGNHSHVQLNNANFEGYRERKLAGAIQVQ